MISPSRVLRDFSRNARVAFGLSWRVSHVRTAMLVVIPLAQSLVPAALALVVRSLVDAAVEVQGTGSLGDLQRYVLLAFGLSAVLAIAHSLQFYLLQSNLEALEHALSALIIEHASKLDFADFEDPRFQDQFEHLSRSPATQVHEFIDKFVRSLSLAVTIGSLLLVLAAIEARLLLYVVPLTIPYLWFRSMLAARRYRAISGQQRGRRWANYYAAEVTRPEGLAEVRTLDLAPLFVRRLRERLGIIHAQNARLYRIEFVGSATFNMLAVILVHLALYQAAVRVSDGELSVGDIAIFTTAAAALRSAIEGFVTAVGAMRWHTAHLAHLRAFFAAEPSPPRLTAEAKIAGSMSEPGALVFDNVTFTYPHASAPTLDGLSLQVARGETVALVGRNGSGKSTLVKLAAGLYGCDRGVVRIGGHDAAIADRELLQSQCSIVFQQFGRYNGTLAENIAMGHWRELLDAPETTLDIADRVGLTPLIDSLPAGQETLLGRSFGQTDLSGGQWQTVAIARAFARDTPVMILDEPTANLDAEAEYEVFSRFKELASGRATLLISHRFSTLALADRIVVLDNGRADEQGTHAELIARGGTYARLYAMYRQQGEPAVWDDLGEAARVTDDGLESA